MRYKCNKCHKIIDQCSLVQKANFETYHYDMYHYRIEWVVSPYPAIGAYGTSIICGPLDILSSQDLNEEEEIDKWETNLGIKL